MNFIIDHISRAFIFDVLSLNMTCARNQVNTINNLWTSHKYLKKVLKLLKKIVNIICFVQNTQLYTLMHGAKKYHSVPTGLDLLTHVNTL